MRGKPTANRDNRAKNSESPLETAQNEEWDILRYEAHIMDGIGLLNLVIQRDRSDVDTLIMVAAADTIMKIDEAAATDNPCICLACEAHHTKGMQEGMLLVVIEPKCDPMTELWIASALCLACADLAPETFMPKIGERLGHYVGAHRVFVQDHVPLRDMQPAGNA